MLHKHVPLVGVVKLHLWQTHLIDTYKYSK